MLHKSPSQTVHLSWFNSVSTRFESIVSLTHFRTTDWWTSDKSGFIPSLLYRSASASITQTEFWKIYYSVFYYYNEINYTLIISTSFWFNCGEIIYAAIVRNHISIIPLTWLAGRWGSSILEKIWQIDIFVVNIKVITVISLAENFSSFQGSKFMLVKQTQIFFINLTG